MLFYFRYEKARMERKRIADMSKGVGKPKVGGPFELTDQNGETWNSTKEMGGKFSLVCGCFLLSAR
jgi:protein SCO1/2